MLPEFCYVIVSQSFCYEFLLFRRRQEIPLLNLK